MTDSGASTSNNGSTLFEPKSTPPTGLRNVLIVIGLVIVFVLATIIVFVRGVPAPSFPPLQQTSGN
jgi:hypothetical protein